MSIKETILDNTSLFRSKSVSQDLVQHASQNRTRFSTEIFLRKPKFFMSDDDLMSRMSPIESWVKIGDGSFGEVFKAKWLGVDVAVKASGEPRFINSENSIFEEYMINSNIRHPNIVNFFVASPNYIVMELMTNGTLDTMLISKEGPTMEVRRKWCSQIAMSVRYLHDSGIVHSDIKPENIMFDSNWDAKLCDIGGGYYIEEDPHDKTYTDMYIPLSLHIGKDKKALGMSTDMYSLCAVILCIMSWETNLYGLLGIPHFERRFSDRKLSRKDMIEECLETCIPMVYNLIQSYDLPLGSKQFLFKMFTDPCKNHVNSTELLESIEKNDSLCKGLSISCLSDM